MQFLIVAQDAPGLDTSARRQAARAVHMEGLKRLRQDGRIIDAGAILDEAGAIVGSVILCDCESREALDRYLADEVFAREGIWNDISVRPMRRVDWPLLMGADPA